MPEGGVIAGDFLSESAPVAPLLTKMQTMEQLSIDNFFRDKFRITIGNFTGDHPYNLLVFKAVTDIKDHHYLVNQDSCFKNIFIQEPIFSPCYSRNDLRQIFKLSNNHKNRVLLFNLESKDALFNTFCIAHKKKNTNNSIIIPWYPLPLAEATYVEESIFKKRSKHTFNDSPEYRALFYNIASTLLAYGMLAAIHTNLNNTNKTPLLIPISGPVQELEAYHTQVEEKNRAHFTHIQWICRVLSQGRSPYTAENPPVIFAIDYRDQKSIKEILDLCNQEITTKQNESNNCVSPQLNKINVNRLTALYNLLYTPKSIFLARVHDPHYCKYLKFFTVFLQRVVNRNHYYLSDVSCGVPCCSKTGSVMPLKALYHTEDEFDKLYAEVQAKSHPSLRNRIWDWIFYACAQYPWVKELFDRYYWNKTSWDSWYVTEQDLLTAHAPCTYTKEQ